MKLRPLRDPDRIQTCNLLIRSQMLYSVKLRGHGCQASAVAGLSSTTRLSFIRAFLPVSLRK